MEPGEGCGRIDLCQCTCFRASSSISYLGRPVISAKGRAWEVAIASPGPCPFALALQNAGLGGEIHMNTLKTGIEKGCSEMDADCGLTAARWCQA